MGKDFLDNLWIFDAGNHLDGTAAGLAGLNVYVEYAFQTLRPGHRGAALGWRPLICLVRSRNAWLTAFTPLGRGDQCPVFVVRSEDTMKAGKVNAWFGGSGLPAWR